MKIMNFHSTKIMGNSNFGVPQIKLYGSAAMLDHVVSLTALALWQRGGTENVSSLSS